MVWDDIRYFLAVVRSHSLTDAGRHLRVSASTVSRRIDALEDALERRLFRRHRGGYTLTPAGARLVAEAEAAEARILGFQRGASADDEHAAGVVRVATPELLAHELILPRLGAFCASYFLLTLELITDVRPVSLARDEADVVVRAVRPTGGAYALRRIGRIEVGLFAAADYVGRDGVPGETTTLAGHRLITWDRDLDFLEMARWLAAAAGDARIVLRTSTYTAQLAACRAGCGLAALPAVIAERHGLKRVPLQRPPLFLDLWLVVRSDLRATRRVAVVCDFLVEVFSALGDRPAAQSHAAAVTAASAVEGKDRA